MNTAIRFAVAAVFGVATVMPAFAQDTSHQDRFYRGNVDWAMSTGTNELGSPAGDMPSDREIRLGANGGAVNVSHGETVKFVMPGGREFRWRFDTLRNVTSFPLSRIAPENMSGQVYVSSDNKNNLG